MSKSKITNLRRCWKNQKKREREVRPDQTEAGSLEDAQGFEHELNAERHLGEAHVDVFAAFFQGFFALLYFQTLFLFFQLSLAGAGDIVVPGSPQIGKGPAQAALNSVMEQIDIIKIKVDKTPVKGK